MDSVGKVLSAKWRTLGQHDVLNLYLRRALPRQAWQRIKTRVFPRSASPSLAGGLGVNIPQSTIGLAYLRMGEHLAEWQGMGKSRLELWRRLRKANGPGTVELLVRDFILVPIVSVRVVLVDYALSFFRVNQPFAGLKDRGHSARATTWHEAESHQQKVAMVSALVAVATIILGITVQELQFRGYVPLWSEDCANPTVNHGSCIPNPCTYVNGTTAGSLRLRCSSSYPNEDLVNKIKVANTLLTCFLFLSTYVLYRYEANISSLRNHVEFNEKLVKYDLKTCGLLNRFLLELVVNVVHQVSVLLCYSFRGFRA